MMRNKKNWKYIILLKKKEFQHWRSDEKQKEFEINNFGLKKGNFSTGGLVIGGRPKCLLIRGDHLFLNYIFLGGSGGWLIGRG